MSNEDIRFCYIGDAYDKKHQRRNYRNQSSAMSSRESNEQVEEKKKKTIGNESIDQYECHSSCVLLSTGSFNPIHRGHLKILTLVKQFLENHPQRPLNVLAAYLSPTHDSYVKNKLGEKNWIPAVERIRLCESALNDDCLTEWVSIARGESEFRNGFVDFDMVTKQFGEFLNSFSTSQKTPVKVVYVCGLDHFNRCPYVAQIAEQENLACVVIYRPGANEERIRKLETKNSNVYYFDLKDSRETLEDISSTMIRNGNPNLMRHLTYDAVIEYLKEHR